MIVVKAIENERKGICLMCEEYFAMTDMCKKCACIIRLKSRFQAAKCPLGKWEAARRAAHEAELAKKNS